jgi:inorganic pyrophosphatase
MPLTPGPEFWAALEHLVAQCALVIDRPRGSTHPRFPDLRYPLDYGYLEGTRGGDGAGQDVWVGSLPSWSVTAVIVTVDQAKRDVEVKLLLGCTPEEARGLWKFHNDGAQTGLLLERDFTN